MLRVLHVDPERGFSGGETQVLALVRRLREFGLTQAVAALPDSPLAARMADEQVPVVAIPSRASFDPRTGLLLRRQARQWQADIVHFHTARALTWAVYIAEPTLRILTRRMDTPPRGGRAYVRWLFGQCDEIIAISAASRRGLELAGIPSQRVSVVHSGIEPEFFVATEPAQARLRARQGFGVGADEPLLAIVASLHERKGHRVLFEALAQLADAGLAVRCLVAGSGPQGQALRDLALRLGIHGQIHWLGQVADARPVYWAADLVVAPSLAEGLGIGVLEALAAGTPVIASAVGGLLESVRDGRDGILVPPGDCRALANAVRRLLEAPQERARLSGCGAARAQSFSTRAMAEGTRAVYERAMASRGVAVGRGKWARR